ncbi:hypothetical protein N0609_31375 [Pseudomonas aeruginosa]|nr:hypothetical protein [Pseudomonas aeruginosa]MCS8513331.1 hypothetical protein [Pseudomonas aeruginosa]MCS8543844.1 hypothetical protein [Pseudomonas aeruginosa]MCT0604155.1 hypothetical protein [Pseudomonas aeruginosa]
MGSGEPLATIGVKLPVSKKLAFEAYLKKRGTNPSVFLRQAIYELLEKVEQGEEQLALNLNLKK